MIRGDPIRLAMTIAVILGSGPDVDLVCQNLDLLPSDAITYFANVSEYAIRPNPIFPILDVLNWGECRRLFDSMQVTGIILIGSLQLRAPRVRGTGSIKFYKWVSRDLLRGVDRSDAIRYKVARKHRKKY